VIVQKAFKYRFFPTDAQAAQLAGTFGCARFVYNQALEYRSKSWQQEKKSIGYHDTALKLTEWKKEPEKAFLSEVSSVVLQQSLRNLDTAFINFFEERAQYPKFKSRRHRQCRLTRRCSRPLKSAAAERLAVRLHTSEVVRIEKGHTEGLDPKCDRTFHETDRIPECQQYPKAISMAEGDVNEVTIPNYHDSALFVLLSRIRYEACQHGGFDFRLASVARSAT
jgi:Helix-turn-helix domain